MSPVSTRLATTSRAMVAATTPALRRLVTRDHDEDGPRLDFRARRRAHLRDATRGGREQLVLHLHRLECGEGRVDVDPITLLDVHGLQETRHRSAQLDPVPSCSDRPATGAECAFVDDNSANIMAVDIEAEWVVRHHRDLVALALEHDRPLAPANGLAHFRRDDAVFDRESAVFTELHADATSVERDLVTHQRSASSRPARAHGPSADVTARRSVRDRSARTAASAARLESERDAPVRRYDSRERIFSGDAALDGRAAPRDLVLRERQRLARRDPELERDEIETGDHLRNWVLDLQARVHLEEVEPPVHLDQELHRPGVHVSRALGDADGGRTQLRAQGVGDARPRRLLDQLLVTPLDRAVTFSEPDDVAALVREYLHLDVARAPDLTLQVQSGGAEGRGR